MEGEIYRLDELWLLDCSYKRSPSNTVLVRCEIIQRIQDVWVEPPTGFTGEWMTYYANGQLSRKAAYRNGKTDGEITSFYSDGKSAVISHAVNGMPDGAETGYYPSGKVKYRGAYKQGIQVGKWVWLNENGAVQSEQTFPQGCIKLCRLFN